MGACSRLLPRELAMAQQSMLELQADSPGSKATTSLAAIWAKTSLNSYPQLPQHIPHPNPPDLAPSPLPLLRPLHRHLPQLHPPLVV